MQMEISAIRSLPEQERNRSVALISPVEDEGAKWKKPHLGSMVEQALADVESSRTSTRSLTERDARIWEPLMTETPTDMSMSFNAYFELNHSAPWRIDSVLPGSDDETAVIAAHQIGAPGKSFELDWQDAHQLDPDQEMIVPTHFLKVIELPRFRFDRYARLTFATDVQQPVLEANAMLPVLRVHCPRQKGCKGVAKFAETTRGGVTGSLKVLGLGGGKGAETHIKYQGEYPARETCMEWAIPATLRLEFGTTFLDEIELAYGARWHVDVADDAGIQEQAVPASQDLCETPIEAIPSVLWANERPFDRRRTPQEEAVWQSQTFEQTTKGKLSLGLNWSTPPVNLSLDFERESTRSYELGAYLAAGSRYLAYYPAPGHLSEICWTTR